MYWRRLAWLLGVSLLAVLPETLVSHPDPRVGFQAWMVLQLLGVIGAAILVAATFSSLGLVLVRLITAPLRDRASVFVAWSFLKAARPGPALTDRLLQRLSLEVDFDAGLGGSVSRWRRLLGGLAWVLGGVAMLNAVATTGGVTTVALRNVGLAVMIHGGLLIAAASPWRWGRLWPFALIVAVVASLCWWLPQQYPAVAAYLHGGAGAGAVLLVSALLFRASRSRRKARARFGLRVGAALIVVAALGCVVALLTSALAWVAPLVLVCATGGYLALSSQPRVTLPVYVSVVGVASGTWALIVVLSVMGGFADDLRGKMLVANAHALVERGGRSKPIPSVAEVSAELRRLPGVTAVSPQVRGDAIISSPFNAHNFVSVRGVDPRLPEVIAQVGSTIITGSLTSLAHPEALMPKTGLRRVAAAEDDVPATPAPQASKTIDDGQDLEPDQMDALLELAPGPGAPTPPQPAPIILDSDGHDAVNLQPTRAAPEEPAAAQPASPKAPSLGGLGLLGSGGGLVEGEGRSLPVTPGVVVGVELANTLQVALGDRVELITPDADVGPTGLRPRVRTFRVAGTFETGLYEVDSKVAYVALRTASEYFNLEGQANVIELRLRDPKQPDETLAQVREVIAPKGDDVEVLDWRDLNRSLFSALAFERLIIFLVLALIILVASFAIVSALTMVIMQKKSGIGMLQAMGADRGTVRRAFVQMGAVIGMIGTTAGLTLGLATCLLVDALGIQLPEAYYVRTLPVAINPVEVGAVVVASMAISLVATIFPAASAARLRPLEGLRHE